MGAGAPAGGSAGGGGNANPEADGSTGMEGPVDGAGPPNEGGSAALPTDAAVDGLDIPGVRSVTGATGPVAGRALLGGTDASALAIRRSGKGRAGAAGRLLAGTFARGGGIIPGTAGTTDGSRGVRGTGPPAGSTEGAARSWSDGSIGMLADAWITLSINPDDWSLCRTTREGGGGKEAISSPTSSSSLSRNTLAGGCTAMGSADCNA